MSSQQQRVEDQRDRQTKPGSEPPAVAEKEEGVAIPPQLASGLAGAADSTSPGDQPGGLSDTRFQLAQRQARAAALGRLGGNRYLQRVVGQMRQGAGGAAAAESQPAPASFSPPATDYELATEVVEVDVHPPPESERPAAEPDRSADETGALSKAVTESKGTGKAPVDTEDLKISYVAASAPSVGDLSPADDSGLTTIAISDVDIQGTVYQTSTEWKIAVTSARTTVHWGINSSGYQIPNPTTGGNITEGNWESVIQELESYQTNQCSGDWHVPEASRVHELNHVAWFQSQIRSTWRPIETTIHAHTLGPIEGTTREAAETAMATYLDQKRREWFNAYGVAPEGPAYAAGQAVLNRMVTRIRNFAREQGWTT